jgi:16S rRNA processing protein RimM
MNRENSTKKTVCIGKIISAHGIKGLVKIKSFAEDPMSLEKYNIYNHTGTKKIDIHFKSKQKDLIIASIEGVEDRNSAESLVGLDLYVNRNVLPHTDEEEFYITDIVNMDVYSTDKKLVGSVKSVQNFGAGDILEILFKPSNKTEFFIFTKENFPVIDIKHNLIKINLF